ncbi:MAG: M16 family metallopeptidase, partial [Chitinophagaceae bacterium]
MENKTIAKEQLNRKQPPRIKDAIEFEMALKPYDHFVLDNGIEVYALNAGPEEVIQMEWVFRAGNWYENVNGIAGATNFLLKNGTSKYSAYEISEHFDFYGSYLNRNCYNETSNITLHSLSKHVAELLPVVSELIMDSVFPQQELEIYKQNMKQRLDVNLKKCDFVANRMIDEYLYGFEHPYGRYGTFESYAAINRDQIVAYHDRYYKNGYCSIFVAGLLPKDFKEQLNLHFGKLPLNQNKFDRIGIKAKNAAQKKYRIDNDKNGVQGAIRLARPFIDRRHPDYFGCHVLNTLFGGFFGSRLMSNIREDKGYTYGIHSYLQNHMQE